MSRYSCKNALRQARGVVNALTRRVLPRYGSKPAVRRELELALRDAQRLEKRLLKALRVAGRQRHAPELETLEDWFRGGMAA